MNKLPGNIQVIFQPQAVGHDGEEVAGARVCVVCLAAWPYSVTGDIIPPDDGMPDRDAWLGIEFDEILDALTIGEHAEMMAALEESANEGAAGRDGHFWLTVEAVPELPSEDDEPLDFPRHEDELTEDSRSLSLK